MDVLDGGHTESRQGGGMTGSGQQNSEPSKFIIESWERDIHECVRECVFVYVRDMVDNLDMCYTLSATSMTLISCPPYHSIALLCSELWICFFDLLFSSAFPYVYVKYTPDKSSYPL